MDQSDARSKRQNAASPIGNVCGDRRPERGEAFRSAPWRPSGQRLEREDRAAAGRGQRGRCAAVGLVDRMQVDVVRILVVWMIVEMHLDLVALADAVIAPFVPSSAARDDQNAGRWNGHRFFGLKAVRDRASNTKSSATPKPSSLLDIGMSPTHAAFAPATPDRTTHLATKESVSACANESARRPTGEGGPKAHRIGSRKEPRSDPSEALRQAQAVQEVETPDQIAEAQRLASEWKPK